MTGAEFVAQTPPGDNHGSHRSRWGLSRCDAGSVKSTSRTAHSQMRNTAQPAFLGRASQPDRGLRSAPASHPRTSSFFAVSHGGQPCQRLARQRSSIAKPQCPAIRSMAKSSPRQTPPPVRLETRNPAALTFLILHLHPSSFDSHPFKAVCLLHPV